MLRITSQELQRQVGEVQLRAAKAPVIITNHGRPRSVLMSAEEFVRLKELAGEPSAIEGLQKRAATFRNAVDALGYDVSNQIAAMLLMARDAQAGRTKLAVESELAAVRERFGGHPR
jgi:prevent-host-death family protein